MSYLNSHYDKQNYAINAATDVSKNRLWCSQVGTALSPEVSAWHSQRLLAAMNMMLSG